MNTLVIYDSQFGNTRKVAEAIGKALGPGATVAHINEMKIAALAAAELLVVGTPTHGGRPSQPMQQFLNNIAPDGLKDVRAATFDTGIPADGQKAFMRFIVKFFGYASKRLAKILKSKGANIIAAETFFVLGKEGPMKDGELDRAKEWGRGLSM